MFHNFIAFGGVSNVLFFLVIGVLAFLIPTSSQTVSSLSHNRLGKKFSSEVLFKAGFSITIENFPRCLLALIYYLILPMPFINLGLSEKLANINTTTKVVYLVLLLVFFYIFTTSLLKFLDLVNQYSASKKQLLGKIDEHIQGTIDDEQD